MLTSLLSIIVWLLIVEILAYSFLPLWCRVFNRPPDLLLGISRILSFFLFSWISWMLSEYAGLPFSAPVLWLLLGIAAISGHFTMRIEWPTWRFFLFNFKLSDYSAYLTGLLLLLTYRFYNPEITWGEKPLEFSLFNYFTKESSLPAEHPWAAGKNMSYYYVGFYALGILQKLSALEPSIAFNLSLAFIGGTLLSAYHSIFRIFGFSSAKSLAFAALLVFGASLNPVYLILKTKDQINFDLFWLTSRNFTSPAFAEYPIWSLLFADLHAHVISMPLVISIFAITALSLKDRNIPGFTFCGFFWGLLYSVNGWDFVTVAFFLALVVGFYSLSRFRLEQFKSTVIAAISLGFGALISFIPFRQAQQQIYSSGFGWVTKLEFNSVHHILLHFGTLIGLGSFSALGLIIIGSPRRIKFNLLLLSLLLPIAVVLFSYTEDYADQAWTVMALSFILIILFCLAYLLETENSNLRFACCMMIAACTLITLVENMYLIDRMNSIFKGYQIIWPLTGISACIYFGTLSSRFSSSFRGARSLSAYSLYSLSFIFICTAVAGSIIDIKAMLTMKRSSNKNFSLVGNSYLESDDADEALLIRWLQKNVPQKAYITEAFGPSYQEYGRVVMQTGLPSLIGWDHHTKQGGVPEHEVLRRIQDVKEIYNSTNAQRVSSLLQYYGIDFVFVGKLEKLLYTSEGIDKFANNPQYFIPVAASGRYALYLSAFSPLKYSKNIGRFADIGK